MKQVLYATILFFLACNGTLSAQVTRQNTGEDVAKRSHDLTQAIIRRLHPGRNPLAKGTSLQERIIASSTYDSGVLKDSSTYSYATYAHGFSPENALASYQEIQFTPWQYNLPMYAAITNPQPAIQYDRATHEVFVAAGVSSKSAYAREYNSSGISRESVVYSGNWGGGPLTGNDTTTFGYDATGRLNVVAAAPNNTTTDPTTNYRTYGPYGAAKDSIEYSSYTSPILFNKADYAYNATGQLVTIKTYRKGSGTNPVWTLIVIDSFTYDAANRLSTSNQFVYSLNPVLITRDTFGYTGSNLTYTAVRYKDTVTSGWYDAYATKLYYNAANDLDSEIIGSFNAGTFTTRYKYTYNYNSMRHFSTVKFDRFDGTGTGPRVSKFYYETYDPTGVKPAMLPSFNARIYPNPATSNVTIQLTELPSKPVSVFVYNAVGQMIQSATVSLAKFEISLNGLASGNYLIKLQNGEAVQELKIVKE